MADENQAEQAKARRPGVLRKAAAFAGLFFVAVFAAVATYAYLVAPRLDETADNNPASDGRIPPTAVSVVFEDAYANVKMSDPNMPAALLSFRVSLECANTETLQLVERHKSRFTSIINQAHQYKHREELDNPEAAELIRKEILEKCNSTLRRLQEEPDDDIRILTVLHEAWTIQD